MKLTMRMYRVEDDYWRIREFLRQVFRLIRLNSVIGGKKAGRPTGSITGAGMALRTWDMAGWRKTCSSGRRQTDGSRPC